MEKKGTKQKKSQKSKKTGSKKKDKSEGFAKDKVLFIGLAIVALVFLALFSINRLGILEDDPEPTTIDDLHQVNIDGDLDEEQGYVHNGFSFVYLDGLWFTQLQKADTNKVYDVKLHYSPKDLKDVFVIGDVSPFQNLAKVYLTFDPKESGLKYVALAAAELSINLAMVMATEPIAACTVNVTEACYTRPIVNCTNSDRPVIYLKESELVGVSVKDNCITVSGTDEDLVRATDRLLLQFYGIME
jgi:hypothetical protein